MNIDLFFIPMDTITKRFKEVLKEYDNLPASFYDDTKGLALLELKKGLIKPIKEIPLLSKLKNGDYQTEKSKSDYKIVKDITFFINNLPSFKKYKNEDNLSFIVKNTRLLLLEILEYYKNKNISLKTIEGRISGILRILFITYNDKTYPIYRKFSTLMLDLLLSHRQNEDRQELNENEQKRFIPFEVIIKFQKDLLEQYQKEPTYKNNQDLLLVSLYRYLPERNELKLLKYTETKETDDDYIYMGDEVYLLLNKSKKKHNKLHLNLTNDFKELAEILKDSYQRFKRTYIFTDYYNQNKSVSIQGLYKRMINLFSFTNKKVGVNIIRSSYLTYQAEQKRLTVADKKRLAILMRTRKDKIDDAYIKILPKEEKEEILNNIIDNIPTLTKTNIKDVYNKQLINNKSYYEKNKNKIIERIKQNQANKPKEEVARKRILYYLNGDESYKDKVKKETLSKYNITFNNGRWI